MKVEPMTSTSKKTLPLVLAISGFSFVVGGALTYQVVKMTSEPTITAQVASASSGLPLTPEVTRNTSETLNSLNVQSAVNASLSPAPVQTAEAIAEEKARKVQEAVDILNANKLRMLEEGIVAGLYSIDEDENNRLKLNSTNAPSAVTDAQNLISAAVSNGVLVLPKELGTTGGEVDPTAVLFNVVQKALVANGETAAAAELQRRAAEASRPIARVENGNRVYTVASGDSLAYIALKFYGSTTDYQTIFDANRDKLTTPDRIFIGQKLRIPNV
ncbi:LysM peptidoglycan-binding domain-containing protein [Nereida ignava]|uniref:LysM peptidoglycan-binding domain-containing protein n=1 Tax=Nereida ignava TaxID=282199 RepID=UPI0023B72D69